ncbi:ABC transporter permease [Dehalococcoidia bacterium]|nr:ABC transporter permease [Dehalococcoidia bacterium]MCL0048770.1 ABC transporter permease [Dehalococcoidia bacterium]
MWQYILRRLILTIPVLIGVSLLVFAMVRLVPGCPAVAIAGVHATPEFIEQVRRDLGLDRPLHTQYFIFMGNLLRGDLGVSTRTGRPAATEIWDKFPNTVELAMASMLVASVIGIIAGVISATRQYSIFDSGSMLVALFGVSVPVFWLGLMLMLLFAVTLDWLPAGGRGGTIEYLILPAITLGTASAAIIARMTRSNMLEVLRQDFITTARAKGLRERIVTYKHALKNALIPVVTIIGLQSGILLGGAVLTETVFAWPGVGRLMVDSIMARDFPVVQGAVLLFAVCFVFINLFVDILYSFLDPRIRYE